MAGEMDEASMLSVGGVADVELHNHLVVLGAERALCEGVASGEEDALLQWLEGLQP